MDSTVAGDSARPGDARRILATRALRGFADGLVSVLLATWLTRLGWSPGRIGGLVAATLLGSAALTIVLGLVGHRFPHRAVLLASAALMLATGLAFASTTGFWPLLLVATLGTLNPSAGDVSVFLPAEQAALAGVVPVQERTRLFALYNVAGNLGGALGALASGGPALLSPRFGVTLASAERSGFLVYSLVAVACGSLYAGLRSASPDSDDAGAPLERSRSVVLRLAALFSLDSFAGGFAVQSILALWLLDRFGLEPQALAVVFFASSLLGGASQLVSPVLARRIGLVHTMVWTHLPANLFLVAAGFAGSAASAIACLLARSALSQMDVPARQALVMSLVPPRERAAAASFTNVPRSLAAAVAPALAGLMLGRSSVGWPLVLAGILKIAYDLLLLRGCGSVRPWEERRGG